MSKTFLFDGEDRGQGQQVINYVGAAAAEDSGGELEVQVPTVPSSLTEFTQTFSDTATTVPALATPDGAAESGSGGYVFAAEADFNELVADVEVNRELINSCIDILQAAGLAG